MKEQKEIPVSYLNPGCKFKFVGLPNFKDCVVKRNSDCGTWIQGFHRQGKDDPWKVITPGFVVSNNSLVYSIN